MRKILTYTGFFLIFEFILFYTIYLETNLILKSIVMTFTITCVIMGFTFIGGYIKEILDNNNDDERKDYD